MNNKDYIASVAAKSGYSLEDTQKIVKSVLAAMGSSFEDGNAVQVNGFGSFEVKKRLERVIINPTSGQRMLVPPKLVLGFKQSDSWKTEMRNEGGRK